MNIRSVFCSLALASVSGFGAEVVESEGGFAYDLPTDWVLKDMHTPSMKCKMAFGREGNISFTIVAFTGNLVEFAASFFKEAQSRYAAAGLTNFKIINRADFETSTKQMGLQVVTQIERTDGKVIRQIMYFFERKDGKKIGAACSYSDEPRKNNAPFDGIMKSLRVTR